MLECGHVVSLVLNGIVGDSRVIKTAKAAKAAGYRATIVGVTKVDEVSELEIEGVRTILVPSPLKALQMAKLWPADKDKRQLWLMVEGALKAMIPVVEELQPDLLHSHDMSGLRVGAALSRRLAAKGKHVPWVHDIHEYVVGLTTVPENYRLSSVEYERRYLRQADHLITVSDRLADVLKSHYNLRKAPTVIYNAPSRNKKGGREAPDVRSHLGLGPEHKLVVYIGVAKQERGCETILTAVASLPDVHLCFVSDSGYVKLLRDKAVELGMEARFHSVPYVQSDEVTSYIRTADVGIHGLIHYPNGEVAMPNKMFEYLQAGIPMVVSDVAEMKRFVEKHRLGTVFEAGNSISCAWAIRNALSTKAEIAACISPRLRKIYCWEAQAEKLAAIYKSLIEPRETRTLWITDALNAETVVLNKTEDLAIVDTTSPSTTCDIYIDPSTSGDRAGVLSRLVENYSAVRLVGNPQWPTEIDLIALHECGLVGSARKSRIKSPVLKGARTTLLALEKSHLRADEEFLALQFELGKSVSRPMIIQGADASVLLELKAAKKKIVKLSVTVKEQRKAVARLETIIAKSTAQKAPMGNSQTLTVSTKSAPLTEKSHREPPESFLMAVRRKLLAPTR